jgi:hypothetical protein
VRRLRRCLGLALLVGVAFGLSSCGGGGKGASSSVAADCGNQAGLITSFPTPTGANFVAVTIDGGPVVSGASIGTINQSYVTITVCAPGSTTNCQTIDHVWVDTGSVGLRLFSSALGTLSLPAEMQGLNVVASCAQFVATYAWGAVRTADISIGSKLASSVPIQVIGDTAGGAIPASAQAPSTCASGVGGALTGYNVPSDMGANGLLGIGVFLQDCGAGCATSVHNGFYYTCPGGTCSAVTMPTNMQVQNVVSLFPTDNNGSLLQLPSVPPQGQATGSGYLIFGINTQSNNQLGSALVFPADPNFGFINTTKTYGQASNVSSFVDSGSNAWFFDDPTLTVCANNKDFFCSTVMLSATMSAYQGFTGTAPSHTYGFCIENLNSAFLTGTWAFNDVGGPGMAGSFDWGLPFFYGRSVFTAIESTTTPPTLISGNPPPFFAASTP